MLCETLSTKPPQAQLLLNQFAALIPFPTAILGLKLLISKKSVTQAHKAAVSQALWTLVRQQLPSTVDDTTVFEGTIVSLAWLITGVSERHPAVEFSTPNMCCAITHTRLVEPVSFPSIESISGSSFSRGAARENVRGGREYQPGGLLRGAAAEDMVTDSAMSAILLAHPGDKQEALILAHGLSDKPKLSAKAMWSEIQKRVSGVPWLRVVRATDLRNSTTPCLTTDGRGFLVLNVGRGTASHSGDADTITLFRTLTGTETEVSETTLAAAVEALDLDIAEELAFDGVGDCDEVVFFCFDGSNSMSGSTGFTDKPDDPDSDDEDTSREDV